MESEGMLDPMLVAVQLKETWMQLEMKKSRGHLPTDLAKLKDIRYCTLKVSEMSPWVQ